MIGETVDNRYQVESLLGRGGMGAVYRATDVVEERPVALKVLHFFLDAETQSAQTRFQREFRVLARLNHPHIMRAYAYGTHNDVPYLALEFLPGKTLTELLTEGPLPRNRLLNISRQLCEALIYLHAESIVHRDLKPGNLMLLPPDDAPQIKLMDFGLVRQTDLSQQLTQEGVALGTVAYMAPEQAQALPIDFRADLYALGVIIYQMATGQTPFTHDNPAMLLMQQMTATPPSPRQFEPDIDEDLETLILELLAKEPAQRPAGTEIVADRLAQLAGERTSAFIAPVKRVDLIPRIPLIGREEELAELRQRWTKAQAGQGQIILLSGATGIGKSRLLTEVGLPAQFSGGRFLTDHCREHASLPYQPVTEVLDALLPDLPPAAREALPVELLRLLPGTGLKSPVEKSSMTSSETQRRLFLGCWELLRQAASQQALIIAIEDVHWADPTVLELLAYLVQQIETSRIMLILTCQPEMVESNSFLTTLQRDLRRNSLAQSISLDPLNREQVTSYLQTSLGQPHLPTWLIDTFYQASDGNPLFLEEILKTLAAEGQLAEIMPEPWSQSVGPAGLMLQLPQNVLDLAERRLELLSEQDRTVVTTAAVIGPDFSFAFLEGVAKLGEDSLLDAIERLLAARLIEELPLSEGRDRYRFTQEALRQNLLTKISQRRLRRLHQRAGETLERLYDSSQSRYWPALAYHWHQAEVAEKAVGYLQKAGEQAMQSSAHKEAELYFQDASSILEKLPDILEWKQQELNLQISLGTVLLATRGWPAPEVGQAYQRAWELCRQVEATPQLLPVLYGLQRYYQGRGEIQTSFQIAKQFLHLAQEQEESAALVVAHLMVGSGLWFLGELAAGHEHFEQGVALYDRQQHQTHVQHYGYDFGVICGSVAGYTLWFLGYPDQALKRSYEALILARELAHPHSILYATSVGMLHSHRFRREAQALQEQAEIVITQSTELNFTQISAWGAIANGWALAEQGYGEEGVEKIRHGLASLQNLGIGLGQAYWLLLLAEAYKKVGQVEVGLNTLLEAQVLFDKSGDRYHVAELHRLKGELLQQAERHTVNVDLLDSTPEACFLKAIEVAHNQQAKSLELRAVTSLARLWQSQGKIEEAREMLAKIYNWFTEGFDTLDLIEAKALLEELS